MVPTVGPQPTALLHIPGKNYTGSCPALTPSSIQPSQVAGVERELLPLTGNELVEKVNSCSEEAIKHILWGWVDMSLKAA